MKFESHSINISIYRQIKPNISILNILSRVSINIIINNFSNLVKHKGSLS
jgi:hypothetical protein